MANVLELQEFLLIALAMFVAVVSVGVFGPRTRGLTLEQISD